jgi:hypothetical protein
MGYWRKTAVRTLTTAMLLNSIRTEKGGVRAKLKRIEGKLTAADMAKLRDSAKAARLVQTGEKSGVGHSRWSDCKVMSVIAI